MRCRVDGGLSDVGAMKESKASIKSQELVVQLLNRDWHDPSSQGGHDWIVIQNETSHDLGDDLGIGKRDSGAACDFICKSFDFARYSAMDMLPFFRFVSSMRVLMA